MADERRIYASGGQIGAFLEMHEVFLNGNKVCEKRKKIRVNDVLMIDGEEYQIVGE